jgi:manganese transport protein
VGTMAGQVIIEGFLDIKFSVFLRRLITIIPSLVVISLKLDPLKILVLSQVALSFAIPFALVPLVILTRSRTVMSDMANEKRTNVMAYVVTLVIIGLNALLLFRILGGEF